MADLTDEQCDDFRRLPGSFNDMVRAIYRAGMNAATPPADAALADDAIIELVTDYAQSKVRAESCRYHYESKEYDKEAADTLEQIRAALRARAVPEADVRDSLISGCAKPCWCDKCHAALLAASKGQKP